MDKEAQTEKPFYERMPESEIETIQVEIKIPKQYLKFWNGIKCMYGLPEDALNQVTSENMIHYLNLIYSEVMDAPVIGIKYSEIKDELVG